MESLDDIKAKRKLQQQIMAKALMTPATIAPGENPVNAWQPLLQALGSKFQDRKLGQQEDIAQKSQSDELANALSLGQGTQGIPATGGNPEQPAVPGNREAMFRALMGSKDPTLQGYGVKGIFEKPQSEYTLGEIGAPGDKKQSVFYNKFDPSKTINAGVATRPPAVQAAEIRQEAPQKAPKDFRFDRDGNLTVIPGSGTDIKNKKTQAGAASSLKMNTHNIDRTLNLINEIENHPGLAGNFGVKGMLPNLPEGQSADAKAKMDTLLNQLGIQTLNDMRASSKTGGAVGNVTEKEWPILQQNIQSLSKAQSEKQVRDNLRQMKDHLSFIKNNATDTYNETYGGGEASTPPPAPGLQKNSDGSYNYVPR